jgi:glucose-1-phosphate thymidylyltransferase
MNKHLLPVYDKPMIFYPIMSMVKSGIEEILLVTGGNAAGDFLTLLGNGKELGVKHLQYTYQEKPSGIADALSLAEDFAEDNPICVMLGDNILENDFRQSLLDYLWDSFGAQIFVTHHDRPQSYGVVEMDPRGQVLSIEEKPQNPKSNDIAIGLYLYDNSVFSKIRALTPSQRGELEVTDLNKLYGRDLYATRIEGWWGDAGESIDTYLEVQNKVKELRL